MYLTDMVNLICRMNLTLENEEWNSNFFSSPDWTGRNEIINLVVTITYSPARNRPCGSTSFEVLVTSAVLTVLETFDIYQRLRDFSPEITQFSQIGQRKTHTHINPKYVKLTRHIQHISFSRTHLHYIPYDPTILKVFRSLFLPKEILVNAQQVKGGKKQHQHSKKSERKGEKEKAKSINPIKTAKCSTYKQRFGP